MNIRRVSGMAAIIAAGALALAAPTVGAQTATYGAAADGRALALNVFGQGLTAGQTHSEINSTPSAVANGTGILNPLSPVGASAAADPADGLPEGSTATEGEQCGGALPAELAAAGIVADLACSTSSATAAGPAAGSASRVGTIGLNPVDAINQTPLGEVVEGVEGGVDQLLEGLDPLFTGIDEGTGLTTDQFIEDLFELLLNGAPLATVTVGDTAAETTATADTVTATCAAEGARIDILDAAPITVDGVVVDAPPLVSIVVGEADTTVAADLGSGEATATANPAIATVRAPALGDAFAEIAVGPGTAQTIELPDPLGNIVISAAGAIETDNEDGSKSVQASAVRIHIFEGSEDLMDGIELALADCTSVAGAVITPTTTAPPETTTSEPGLPRTGGTGTNAWALGGAAGLALLGFSLLRRTQTV